MRKIFSIGLIAIIFFVGCTSASQQIKQQETTMATLVTPPFISPETVELEPIEYIAGDFLFTPTMRRIWYQISYEVMRILPEGGIYEMTELFEREEDFFEEPVEMALVTVIRHFELSREALEEAVVKMYISYREHGFDIMQEGGEIPNLDIVFTFDNEIINAFYRRENPVVPDWNTLVTWESYSAFRAANPQ